MTAHTATELSFPILPRYRHKHLLPLIGYSQDGPQLCLLYEFMPYGSLATWLFDVVRGVDARLCELFPMSKFQMSLFVCAHAHLLGGGGDVCVCHIEKKVPDEWQA